MSLTKNVFGEESENEQKPQSVEPKIQDNPFFESSESEPSWVDHDEHEIVQTTNTSAQVKLTRQPDLNISDRSQATIIDIIPHQSGRLVALKSFDGRVRLFQTDGKLLTSIVVPGAKPQGVCFTDTSLFIFTSTNTLIEIDLETLTVNKSDIRNINKTKFISACSFGDYIAVTTQLNQVLLINKRIKQIERTLMTQFRPARICSNSSVLVVSDDKLQFQIFQLQNDKIVTFSFKTNAYISELAINEQILAIGCQNGIVQIFNISKLLINDSSSVTLKTLTTKINAISVQKYIYYSCETTSRVYCYQTQKYIGGGEEMRASSSAWIGDQLVIGKAAGEVRVYKAE
ncbi:WD40_domain-containing protein [Hexamita inflata]|uniref:WD40 domain-containing protein n=1 Tax=Hexamita inflata TaxID=28002 RepID=A0AA86TGM2_9EUKA|nr:WD40 domain-containing protein [Hexamita inflata]